MPPGSKWSNEGVTRVLGFLIEGAAEHSQIKFEVVVPAGMGKEVEQDLRSLVALEGRHWAVHEQPGADDRPDKPIRASRDNRRQGVGLAAQAGGLLARLVAATPAPLLGLVLGLVALLAFPLVVLLRIGRGSLLPKQLGRRLSYVGIALFQPRRMLPSLARYAARLGGPLLKAFAESLAPNAAVAGSAPQDVPMPQADFDAQMERMAEWANDAINVQGWIVLFPFYRGCMRLEKHKAVIFPDALVYDFPLGWEKGPYWVADGHWPSWKKKCAEVFGSGGTVITFSEHVARRHVEGMFGLSADRMCCIPPAAPDLLPYAPYIRKTDRLGDAGTRRHAANILRAFALSRGLTYLSTFPFEEAPFFIVSTQDRPTKNLGLAANALNKLVRRDGFDIKMITTARFFFGEDWTTLPSTMEDNQLQFDILSMPDLPREVHAALFHCSTLTVHPSFFEGIVGALPVFEAMSVGSPCIAARGPHTIELLEMEPEFERYLFDPYDSDELARLIRHVAEHRHEVVNHQWTIGERIRRRTWGDVAAAYAAAARGQPFTSTPAMEPLLDNTDKRRSPKWIGHG